MGGTTSSPIDWQNYSRSSATQSQSFSQAYTNRSGIKDEFRPKVDMIRESCNSPANPHSTPIIMALDCTGSMSDIALAAKKSFGTLMSETYLRKPVSDPHIMAMFFDDVLVSSSDALQVTQFEADKVILDQMAQLYWVGNGGGNGSESYSLPLHFAINHTACDAFKEGRKGFIFTMGDDGIPPPLTTRDLRAVYGNDHPDVEPLSYETLLTQAEENWHVFHLIPSRGRDATYLRDLWSKVLGERVLIIDDVNKIAEVLVATMQVIGGADAAAVAASFTDPGTAMVVASAIKDLTPVGKAGGVVRL